MVIILEFNIRLKKLRQSKNVSQIAVSQSTGISNRYYQELEYGEKEPTMSKLVALANFFNVSIDYLVGRTDNPEINR